jgi:hypothetical protein
LRDKDFLAYAFDEGVILIPNDKLFTMFHDLEIKTICTYRPEQFPEKLWAEHQGKIVP